MIVRAGFGVPLTPGSVEVILATGCGWRREYGWQQNRPAPPAKFVQPRRFHMLHWRGGLKIAAVLVGAVTFAANAIAAETASICFVYISPIGDSGWTYQHDLGRKEMEKALAGKVTTKYVENVAEGADAERVIRELAQSGCRVVYATSFGYMNYMEKVAKQFPKVTFMHATGYKTGLAGNSINWVAGIINGTSNYILTQMAAGNDFAKALAAAQALGYAEADPTFDVEGIDAAHKLAILAALAFGIRLDPSAVYTEGISRIGRRGSGIRRGARISNQTSGHHAPHAGGSRNARASDADPGAASAREGRRRHECRRHQQRRRRLVAVLRARRGRTAYRVGRARRSDRHRPRQCGRRASGYRRPCAIDVRSRDRLLSAHSGGRSARRAREGRADPLGATGSASRR